MSLHQSLSALRAESESNICLIEHELTYRRAVTEVIARLRQIADSDERPELADRAHHAGEAGPTPPPSDA